MQTKSVSVQFKAGPEDGLAEGQFVVYPATFIRKADSYGDVIAKGAFADDIKAWGESGNVLPGLYGHRMDDPDYFIASATSSSEDDHGWRVEGEFDLENPKAAQVYRLVKGKRLTQLSFAYDVVDEAETTLPDGTKANELRKLKTYEFSFVPIGANQDTSVVAIKSVTDSLINAVALKEGRVLAAKHIDSLRNAQEAIGAVIAAAEGSNDQEKASGTREPVKDDDADHVKSDEPMPTPTVDAWAARIQLTEMEYAS